MIKIEKEIYVRDRYGVKRTQWLPGDIVPSYIYHSVLRTNTPVNPEDLPVEPKTEPTTPSFNTGMMETKVLPAEPEVVDEPEEEVKEVVVKKTRSKTKKKAKK